MRRVRIPSDVACSAHRQGRVLAELLGHSKWSATGRLGASTVSEELR